MGQQYAKVEDGVVLKREMKLDPSEAAHWLKHVDISVREYKTGRWMALRKLRPGYFVSTEYHMKGIWLKYEHKKTREFMLAVPSSETQILHFIRPNRKNILVLSEKMHPPNHISNLEGDPRKFFLESDPFQGGSLVMKHVLTGSYITNNNGRLMLTNEKSGASIWEIL